MTDGEKTSAQSIAFENDPFASSPGQHNHKQGHEQGHEQGHRHSHHRTGRLHKLFHPSGKIFHIVNYPHEVQHRREQILREDPGSSNFDILVHGTDEHISTIRDIHLHQTKSRDALFANNEDLLNRYDTVKDELDSLSRELHDLTDHAVSLDASFDKWGYSARLRTHGDSETTSLDDDHMHDASKHQDRTLTAMKFFKAPVVRQYFHKGLIWRSPQCSEVVSFELFVDLVYVAVIDALGEVAVEEASGASFLHYIIIFCIASKVFNDILTIMNWFEINDIFGRLCALFIVVCLYAFSTNTEYFFETTYAAGISFYLASRFLVALWFFFAATLIPMIRWTLVYHGVIALIAAAIWIGSIHVSYPHSLALIFIAIFVDMFGSAIFIPIIQFTLHRRKNKPDNSTTALFKAVTNYLPAMNIEHRVERTGAFVSLVIGYSVIKIFFQSHSKYPMDAFLGKGILGLIQAFIFNWIYFEIDAGNVHVHAIRRHWLSTTIWNTGHVPFSAAFILAASTLSQLVIAHDCSDADETNLADTYATQSLGEIEPTLRWFYCGGLGVSLICMSIISLCHIHKKFPNAKLSKRLRLGYRTAVAVVIICLPLAPASHLSSLDLITITTCLTATVLVVDIFGLSCAGDGFFRGAFCPERKRRTQYTAKCKMGTSRRREMRSAVQRGEKLDLDQLFATRDPSLSSLDTMDTRVDRENTDKSAGGF